jgi:hypothetical protein
MPSCKKRRRDNSSDYTETQLQMCVQCTAIICLRREGRHTNQSFIPTIGLLTNFSLARSSHQISDAATLYGIPASTSSGKLAGMRKIMSLRTPKKQRTISHNNDDDRVRSSSRSPQIHCSPAKELQETTANDRRPSPVRIAPGLLARCHICHRKPMKKSDLNDYADCQGCGERTCYICIRECSGWQPAGFGLDGNRELEDVFEGDMIWEGPGQQHFDGQGQRGDGAVSGMQLYRNGYKNHQRREGAGKDVTGHRQRVCSRCCVEKGADGDVVCLGCLAYVEG